MDDVEENVFNPYNDKNNEITLNHVQCILNKYGVTAKVNNLELYKRAFIHRSYTKKTLIENEKMNITIMPCPNNMISLKSKSNERLEFIGDGVLELITKYYLYRRFPNAEEGFMTEKKIAIVKNEHIGRLAYEMNLHKWFILSKNAEEKKTRTNLKKLGCLFEAFIGALFLDFNHLSIEDNDEWFQKLFVCGPGFQMAQIFVENIFEEHVDWVKLINTDDNYKNILQVIIQKEFRVTPYYKIISQDVDIGFCMGLYLCIGYNIHSIDIQDAELYSNNNSIESIKNELERNNKIFILLSTGTHKIKKKAEQIACGNILRLMNH